MEHCSAVWIDLRLITLRTAACAAVSRSEAIMYYVSEHLSRKACKAAENDKNNVSQHSLRMVLLGSAQDVCQNFVAENNGTLSDV